jgi:PAS domain S-box-containing protein
MAARLPITDALREAALAVSTAEGERVFEQLVASLARILGVDFALISVYVEPQRTHLRTLATYFGGRLAKNIEYPVAGTPCEQAIGRAFAHHPKGVKLRFPNDVVLGKHAVEGYAATTLHDVDGAPIGALTVMSTGEIGDAGLAEALLNIFAARVSAEIGRRRSEASYRAIFESAETAIILHDIGSGAVVDVNPKACAAFGYSAEELKRLTVGELSSGEPPYTGEEARRLVARAAGGEVVRGQWHRRNKDGSLHWDEYTLKRVEIAGKPHIMAATREITERKAAEDALRSSEEQYRAIFNASTDSLTLRDAEFRIVDVNAAYERMSGLRRADVLGATELTLDLLDVRDWRREVHDRALAGEAMRLESEARRRDGTRFRLEVLVLPMQYGGAPHALYVARDITERKRAEAALRSSEEQYRAIFDATTDGLTLRDAGFRIVDANPAYARMTGYALDEMIGTDRVTTLSLRDVKFARELHGRALAGEQVRIESKAMRKDGSLFDCEVYGVPMSYRGAPHVLYIGRDVTARTAAEQALRASEEQYREIFNAAADALVLRDDRFRIVDVNAAYEAMSGKRRDEVVGLTDLTLTRSARVVDRRALHVEALAGTPVFFEADGAHEDGSPFVLEVRGVPMVYRGARHVLYIGRDVTEAKLAERALRASEEQYRAIFNSAADGLVLRDADYRVVDVNRAYEPMSGLTRREMIGTSGPLLQAEDEREGMRLAVHQRALAGEGLSAELDVERRDGKRFRMDLQVVPMQYRGAPHVLYVGRDITERKQAEEALRASWEQYRAIFDATADSLVLRDAEFRIVDVNPSYEAMSGRSRAEALGRQDVTMSDPALAARIKGLHARALAGEPVTWEAQARRKSGEAFSIEVRGLPIRHQGQPHVLYVGRDITERKRAEAERGELEAQLRQAQKMEAIGQLTGGIAHDFNNILQGILGNLVLAEERQEELGDEKLGRFLERAHGASQRARDLIQQMLTFSRGRGGERRPATASALIADATRLLRPTLPATIELDTSLAPDLPGALLDTVQFEQVLLNLCINARDAMQGAGRIALAARLAEHRGAHCASCRERIDGRFLEISVRDSGPGIAPEVLERMFDPFFSTKEVGKGSGMGLAMVHGIVHRHGGHVLVDTAAGAGATFRVLVPPAAKAVTAGGRAATPSRKSEAPLAGRVLLAEDEPSIRELLEELLRDWGLQVRACADGAAAQDAFAQDPLGFDLVLTDQTMPRMTGIQLAALVTRLRPGLPVILCTGYGEDLGARELDAAGVRTLAKKPIEPAELRKLLRAALQTRNKAPT